MKKVFIFISVIVSFIIFTPNVYAEPFYYEYSNGYMLCEEFGSANCQTITKTQNGASFDIKNGQITYNGTTYKFNSSQQEVYNNSFYFFNSEKQSAINASKNTTNNADVGQSSNCTRIKEPLMFIGNIVLVVKIAIPIILIGLGMMDLFKAVTSAKDDELKKSLRGFAMRCVAGVAIFFLPTIVSVVFSMVSSWADLKGEFNACQKCILNVRSCNKE